MQAIPKSEPLSATVLRQLQQAIFTGELRPGDALNEFQLARELGVSQATVRHALLQLEHLELAQKQPGKGTSVTRLSASDVRERLMIRIRLETLAARESARRMRSDDDARLRSALASVGQAVEANDFRAAAEADLALHRQIWKLSGNRLLCETLERLSTPFFAFIGVLRSAGLRPLAGTMEAHAPIVEALLARDGKRAEQTMSDHLEASYRAFLESGFEDFRALLDHTVTAGRKGEGA